MFTVYPAIDLRGGRVVRLKEGDPARMTVYSDDPIQTAQRWLDAGAAWLHVVNLDGAFGESDHANRAALEAICKLGGRIQFGGGLRSLAAIQDALALGVSRAVVGTVAVEQAEVLTEALDRYGPERIAAGIDARRGLVHTRGWRQTSSAPALELALQLRCMGIAAAVFTDISRDGLGSGLNIAAAQELSAKSGLAVIASGGVQTIEDVLAAKAAGLAGCIIGRALYDGSIDLGEAIQVQEPN